MSCNESEIHNTERGIQNIRPDDVLGRFSKIVQAKLSSNTWTSRANTKDFAEEKKLLHSHLSTVYWGIGCALISLISFRTSRYTGPITWSSLKNRFALLDRPSPASIITNPRTQTSEPRSKLENYLSVVSDIVISMLLGCSATLFLIDKDKLIKDLAQGPLIQGESYIADELCPDLMAEYDKIPSSFWDRADLKSGEFSTVLGIRDFVLNCQTRKRLQGLQGNVNGTCNK